MKTVGHIRIVNVQLGCAQSDPCAIGSVRNRVHAQSDRCAIGSVRNRICVQSGLCAIGSVHNRICVQSSPYHNATLSGRVCVRSRLYPIESMSNRIHVRLKNTTVSDNMRNRDTLTRAYSEKKDIIMIQKKRIIHKWPIIIGLFC